VKSGDSLQKIAKKYNVSLKALKEANQLESSALKANQVLVIPGRSSKKTTVKNIGKNTPEATVYVVKKADTLAGVAERTGVPAAEIRQLNELRSSKLKSGQRLVLQPAHARAGEDEDDLEEAGSIETSELAAAGESLDRSGGIVPLELSRWKGPGERDLFVKIVKSYEGVPYKMGGNSIRGIDCSAFTRKVYGIFSVDLPRTAREQLQCGTRVGRDDLDVGDLVFFQTRRTRLHVGIFLGGNEFFHLSSRNRAGKVDNLESSYFNSRFISGVRLKETERNLKAENPLPSLKSEAEKPPVSVRQAQHSPGG
jgi:LysM repeat protein